MGLFSTQLAEFAAKAKDRTGAVVRKTVLDIGARIVQRSPVGDPDLWKHPPPPGYVGGRFRANWQYGFGSIPGGTLPAIDPRDSLENVSTQRIGAGVNAAPVAGIHYIVNNLPYANRLEYDGWSTQAPAGMVGVTIVEFEGIVKEAAKK